MTETNESKNPKNKSKRKSLHLEKIESKLNKWVWENINFFYDKRGREND